MSSEHFPVEISVLSSTALRAYISDMYFESSANVTCRLHYRSIHDTYRVVADGAEYYLKVYRQDLRSKEEIQGEVELIDCLRRHGIQTAQPIQDKRGAHVACFPTADGERCSVLFTSVGNRLFSDAEETPGLNERLGESVALIHRIWDTENPPAVRTPLDAESFIQKSMEHIRSFRQLYEFDIQFLEDVARRTDSALRSLRKAPPAYGFCHGDIYADNIRFNDQGAPVLFDFDFAGMGWRAYDISLYAYGFGLGAEKDTLEKRQRRLDAFLRGYQKHLSLSDEFLESIPLFIPFRRIFNIGSLYIAMANIWGDNAALRSTRADIDTLKRWLELNPVI